MLTSLAGQRDAPVSKPELLKRLRAGRRQPSELRDTIAWLDHGGFFLGRREFTIAINAFGKESYWEESTYMMQKMACDGVEIDIVSCGAAISVCERGEQWRGALLLFEVMRSSSVEANEITKNAGISACEKGQQWQRAFKLLGDMGEFAVESSIVSNNAVLGSCMASQQWTRALRMLAQIEFSKLEPDEFSYSSALSACEASQPTFVDNGSDQSLWNSMLQLLARMAQSNVQSNGIYYGAAMSAATKAGLWGVAFAMLKRLCDPSIESTPFLCCDAGSAKASGFLILNQQPGVIAVLKPTAVTSEHFLDRLRSHMAAIGRPADITMVSRLDSTTSGVLVMAMGVDGSAAANAIKAQFAGKLVSKEYVCLCVGHALGPVATSGEFRTRLSMHAVRRGGFQQSLQSGGKTAHTVYQVLGSFLPAHEDDADGGDVPPPSRPATVLLKVSPLTGRTHQIRAHLASIGMPLVCDALFSPERVKQESLWCPRVFLHCRRISLLDLIGEGFVATAPIPADLLAALKYVRCVDQAGQST